MICPNLLEMESSRSAIDNLKNKGLIPDSQYLNMVNRLVSDVKDECEECPFLDLCLMVLFLDQAEQINNEYR